MVVGFPNPKHFMPSLPPYPPIPRGFTEDLDEETVSLPMPPVGKFLKPGCTAADNSLTVKGHLDGLSAGLGGFGVLRQSKEKMEDAAKAARIMHEDDLAERIDAFAEELTHVQTPDEARVLARTMGGILNETWVLGTRCGANRPVKPD